MSVREVCAAGPFAMVDDNALDRRILGTCLKRSRLDLPFQAFASGVAFLEYLDRVEAGDEPVPTVVMLDINMPEMTGFEVLEALRARAAFASLPVYMLTSSSRPSERELARRMGAGFLTKPISVAETVALLESLDLE